MSGAAFAALGAISGGLVTAISALALFYFQRTSAQRDAHLLRAFEQHFAEYEQIFVTCRSTLDALNDYVVVESKAMERDDPFLFQMLDILKECAYKYCVAVDWKHNPAMAYLELSLEQKCLNLRDLLLRWLSISRITTGDVISIRRGGVRFTASVGDVRTLEVGDYQELIIERRLIVVRGTNDDKIISDIRISATSVISALKAVMAY
jgi:hypothetical protein